jgi:hypothetical protein
VSERLETWRALLRPEHDDLRAESAPVEPGDLAAIARLRKSWPAGLVRAALELAEARRKLAAKWPGRGFVADPEGAEMASGALAAAHKAGRFARAMPGGAVLDLCCGIGADAAALAGAGLVVTAVDRDPLRAWMAGVNAGCASLAADVEAIGLGDRAFHLDPSRRDGGGRRIRYEQLTPGPAFIERVCTGRSGAVKLPPGINPGEPPAGELEYISERGRLTQAVLWTGVLAGCGVSATALRPDRPPATIAGEADGPASIPHADLESGWVHTADPCVERAGLLATLCRRAGLGMPNPQTGLLCGEVRAEDPLLTAFRLRAVMPWRREKVIDWLRAHDGGLVEVKTRGKAADPDVEQPALRGPGDTAFVVFVLRFGEAVRAVVCEREAGSGEA